MLGPVPLSAQSPYQFLKILSYNVYLLPNTVRKSGQGIRAGLLPARLSGYDVIVFNETFDDAARDSLLAGLSDEYPYRTSILGFDAGIHQDGGVIIVSRWPILAEDQRVFRDPRPGEPMFGPCPGSQCCYGNDWQAPFTESDCTGKKGVVYAMLEKQGQRYHIFGTHLQSGTPYWELRNAQAEYIRYFIGARNIPSNEPVIIAGDMNVDKYDQERYNDFIAKLNATHPAQRGPAYSFDGAKNDLNLNDDVQQYLDYVFYSNDHLRPCNSSNELRLIRAREPWREFFWEDWYWDLSDHYPVEGKFTFYPPAPDQPCPADPYYDLLIEGPTEAAAGRAYTLTALPQGGGPDWAFRWNNGATTPHLDAVAGVAGTSQTWAVDVTDLRGGKTLSASVVVSVPTTREQCRAGCYEMWDCSQWVPRLQCVQKLNGCLSACERWG
jgi:hypothetical protein